MHRSAPDRPGAGRTPACCHSRGRCRGLLGGDIFGDGINVATRATLDAYGGSLARSWCRGGNGWRGGIAEECVPVDPPQRDPQAPSASTGADRPPPLRHREQTSPVKNRREEPDAGICTSGSARGGDGNIPTYSALDFAQRRQDGCEGLRIGEMDVVAEEAQAAGRMFGEHLGVSQTPQHSDDQRVPACRSNSKQSLPG